MRNAGKRNLVTAHNGNLITAHRRKPKRSHRSVCALPAAAILCGALILGGGCGPTSQERTSQAAVERAMRQVRPCFVNGSEGRSGWLSVLPDGSIEATGFFGTNFENVTDLSGRHILTGLTIPERVGGLAVYHVIPLLIDDETNVSFRGTATSFVNMLDPQMGDAAGRYFVVVRFRQRAGRFRADYVAYSRREVNVAPWPDQIRGADISMPRIAGDEARPTSRRPWLDISTGSPPFSLIGYDVRSSRVRADPPTGELVSSVEVMAPDRLGGAVVYHLVQIFADDRSLATSTEPSRTGSAEEVRVHKVSLVDGRLMILGD